MDEQPQPESNPAPNSSLTLPAAKRYVRSKRSYLYTALVPLTFVAGLASVFLLWGRRPESAPPSNEG